MERLKAQQLPELFESVGRLFSEKKEELCEMDAKLGDGDLGLTMSKGFGALPDLIRAEMPGAEQDMGKLLMKAGMKMASLIPSTMGFLMSSGLMEAGKAMKGKSEFDGSALAEYLTAFAAGIQKRGKCQAGQRTIYDVMLPAALAAQASLEKDGEESKKLSGVMAAALDAARKGMEDTADMTPVFGKAAVHAAKSAGVLDQGAVAGYYLLLGMSDYIGA